MFNVKSFQLLYLFENAHNKILGEKINKNKDANTYHDKSQLANEGHLKTVNGDLSRLYHLKGQASGPEIECQ